MTLHHGLSSSGKKPLITKLLWELINGSRICCTGIVLAELIQGAKSQKEVDILKEFLYVFDFLPDPLELWEKAGELSYTLRQKGKAVGLSDCYISVTAYTNNEQILTLDKHFEIIGKEFEINLFNMGRLKD